MKNEPNLRKFNIEPPSAGCQQIEQHSSPMENDIFKSLVESLPGMAYRCRNDLFWTMEFVNSGCSQLTGFDPVDLIENRTVPFVQLIHNEDQDCVRNAIDAAFSTDGRFQVEYRLITAAGEIKWVLEQGMVTRLPGRTDPVLQGFILDITERKKVEEQLRFLSMHDPLTGLYSRAYFEEEMKRLDTPRQLPISVIYGDVNALKLVNDAFGHEIGDEYLRNAARAFVTSCRKEDIISRIGGDEFVIFMPKTSPSGAAQVCDRIKKTFHQLPKNPISASAALGTASKEDPERDLRSVLKEAESRMYRSKLIENKFVHQEIFSSLERILFKKIFKAEVGFNSVRYLGVEMGRRLALSNHCLENISLLASFCDVGKIAISDSILHKPGRLTSEEWQLIHKHPETGFHIIRTFPKLAPVAEDVLYHHERWDGSGYPQGLVGDSIPLNARIIAIVNAYDAMTRRRCYRPLLTRQSALEEICRSAGSQFDPKLVEVFVDLVT